MGGLCWRTGGRRLASHLHRLGSGGPAGAPNGWVRACVDWNRRFPDSCGYSDSALPSYDIDILINRTLVYGTLTATLIALYFVSIVVLQRLFVLLTGQQSALAVVASTLLIAALVNPLRRHIQSFMDRRFYRRKYDAR